MQLLCSGFSHCSTLPVLLPESFHPFAFTLFIFGTCYSPLHCVKTSPYQTLLDQAQRHGRSLRTCARASPLGLFGPGFADQGGDKLCMGQFITFCWNRVSTNLSGNQPLAFGSRLKERGGNLLFVVISRRLCFTCHLCSFVLLVFAYQLALSYLALVNCGS